MTKKTRGRPPNTTGAPTKSAIREALVSFLNEPCTLRELALRTGFSEPGLHAHMQTYMPQWRGIRALHGLNMDYSHLVPEWVGAE